MKTREKTGHSRSVAESVMRLFSPDSDAIEREIDDHLRGIHDLIRSSDILRQSGEELEAHFQANQIPEDPVDPSEYGTALMRDATPGGVNVSSPRFLGHMTTALPAFMRSMGKLLVALNQNQVKIETSGVFSAMERETLALLHRLIYSNNDDFYAAHTHDESSCLGTVVTGGTAANITALWCARNGLLTDGAPDDSFEKKGVAAVLRDINADGLAVIGSEMMHYSFDKAVDLLGIGTDNLIRVAAGRDHRVNPAAVKEALVRARTRNLRVVAIVGIAGTTDSGAVDPLPELAELAKEAGAHFHVDACWAGPLLFSNQHRALLDGIQSADSVAIDGHKQLYTPMGLGVLLLRNPALARVIEKSARYIIRAGSRDLGRRSFEGSRPANALYLHAAFRILGRAGYEYLIDEGVARARRMSAMLSARPEFEVLVEPMTNILLYRYLPADLRSGPIEGADLERTNEHNIRLQEEQFRAGHTFVSRTSIARRTGGAREIVALRAVLANPLSTDADIQAVLDDQTRIGAAIRL